MAYKKEDIIKQCLKAIEENKLVWIEEIIAFVPFSKRAFYDHKLHECDDIKKALEDNRIQIKAKLRKNWADSKASVLQIALYRLLATEMEYERLVIQRIDHTTGGDKIQPLDLSKLSDAALNELTKLSDKEINNIEDAGSSSDK